MFAERIKFKVFVVFKVDGEWSTNELDRAGYIVEITHVATAEPRRVAAMNRLAFMMRRWAIN